MDWIKEKLLRVDEIFEEFPSIYRISWLYMAIVCASVIAYQPVLECIYNFELFNQHVFQDLIQNNLHVFRWGQIVVPLTIAIYAWLNVTDMYEKKYFRKYKHYPC